MDKKKGFDQLEYIKNYNKKNYRNFILKLNRFKHQDIINFLEKKENINKYLMHLIDQDMKK